MQNENKPEIKKITRVMQIIAALMLLLVVVAGVLSFLDGDTDQANHAPVQVEQNPFQ